MTAHRDPRSIAALGLSAALALSAALPLAGCRGDRSDKPPRQFFPDLDDQPKYKPQTESRFFKEYIDEETGEAYGRAQREPVDGAVPFGRRPYINPVRGVDFSHREEFLRDDDVWVEGRVYRSASDGAPALDDNGLRLFDWAERIPRPVDQRMIDLGHKMYDIYCLPCHSGTGDGNGLVGQRWSYPLPSFHDDIYQPGAEKGQDGYIFHTIRNGVPNVGGPYPLAMPAYAGKLTIEETWAIVAYFRVLQETRRGSLEDLTESQRLGLERTRSAASAAEQNDQQGTDQASDQETSQ